MEPTSTLPVIALTSIAGNQPAGLNALQSFFAPYSPELVVLWWFVWWLTVLFLLRYVYVHGIRGGDPSDRELYSD